MKISKFVLAWISVAIFFAMVGCASQYDLNRSRELRNLKGTQEEMRLVLNQKRYYFSKAELSSVLDLTAMNYCISKKHNNAKEADIAFDKLKVLVDVGAKVDGSGNYPNPVAYAASCDATELIDYLVSKGATLDIRDPVGNTLLHKAVCNKTLTMTKYLHEKGLSLSEPGHFGDTPMQAAIKCRNVAAIEYLKQNGIAQ